MSGSQHTAVDAGFLHRGRIVITILLIGILLVIGVLLVGWYAGNRPTPAAPVAEQRPGATWVDPQGVLHADASDVGALRADGWTLPLVGVAGYDTVWLRRTTVGGQPAAAMTVVDEAGHRISIVEQRGRIDVDHPIDGVTGLPSTAVGLRPSPVQGSALWLTTGTTWRGQIVHPDAVFTVTSTTSPERMVRILHQVEASDRAVLEVPDTVTPSGPESIVQGWKHILGMS